MRRVLLFLALSLVAGAASAQGGVPLFYVLPTAPEIVLTDPLVRSIQIGPPPVGLVTAYNASTGVGIVRIPGIGARQVLVAGTPFAWNGGRAVRAIDLDTEVQFIGVLPQPPRVVAARVVRASGDVILVRRQGSGENVTAAVPVDRVFAASRGGLTLATRVSGALRRGATVWIPADTRTGSVAVVTRGR